MSFINTGADEALLKSMYGDSVHIDQDELCKAMNRAGLVQKEIQVKGKNGQVFTRKQWVKAGEDQSNPKGNSNEHSDKPETKSKSESKTENKATGEDSEFFTFDRNSSTIRNAEKKYGIKFDMVGDTAKVMSKNGDHVATCKLVNVTHNWNSEVVETKEVEVTFTDGTPTKTYYALRAAMNPIRKKCLGDSVSNSNMEKVKKEFRDNAIKDFKNGKILRVTQHSVNYGFSETTEYKYNKTSGKIESRFIKGTGYLANNKEEKDFKPDEVYGKYSVEQFIEWNTKFDMSSGTAKFKHKGRFL